MTEHAVLSGVVHHLRACKSVGITPIVGVEAYYRPNRKVGAYYGKKSLEHTRDSWSYYHMILLAKDIRGWKSLMLLTSEAFRSGFYRKPCIDDELLDKVCVGRQSGLIASTGCVAGFVPQAILRGDHEEAMDHVDKLDRWFGDDWYGETQPHDFDDQRVVNAPIIAICDARGKPFCVVKDAHAPEKSWLKTQRTAVLMRTKSTIEEANKRAQEDDDYYDLSAADTAYIGSAEDTLELCRRYHSNISEQQWKRALAATGEIADRISFFCIDGSPKLPRFKPDQDARGDEQQLWELIIQGLKERGHGDDPVYVDQARREMQQIVARGVCSFFLITWDGVRWARSTEPLPELPGGSTRENDPYFKYTAKGGGREHPLAVGSRGSAGGSTSSYALKITQINPITYELWFERFLNPNRAGLPDIDLDLSSLGAELIGEYSKRKYGEDKVVDLIAHGTFGPRSAMLRTAGVYGVRPQAQVLSKLIPDDDAKNNTLLEDLREAHPELDRYAEENPDAWEDATRLQSSIGALSEHAAGKVFSDRPLEQFMPVMKKAKGDTYMVTAFGEEASTEIVTKVFGLMKVDFLVVTELAKLTFCEELIKKHYDREVKLDALPPYEHPLDVEERVMKVLREALMGLFQIGGSDSIMQLTRRVGPENINHIAGINAVHRTATMNLGIHDLYAERKNDPTKIEYWDPSVVPILEESFGLMIYQEQVMAICVALGGFTPAEADDIRRIMSKAYRIKGDAAQQMLAAHKERFVSNAALVMATGRKGAEAVWEFMYGFCDYSFNKPHAGEYGLKAYSGAWVKSHYPDVFYTSLLTFPPARIKQPKERRGFYERVIREARHLGVNILPPDVNDSDASFTITRDGVRFGLQSIAGLGEISAADIVAGRPYASMDELVAHTSRPGAKANAGARKALGSAGALDRWGARDLLTEEERLAEEERVLGVPLSMSDRIGDLREPLSRLIQTRADVDEAKNDELVIVGGELIEGEEKKTRKGTLQLKFTLAFGADEYRCSLAPWKYTDAVRALIDEDCALIVRGTWSAYYRKIDVDVIERARDVLVELGMLDASSPIEAPKVNANAFDEMTRDEFINDDSPAILTVEKFERGIERSLRMEAFG
jgi:DNA polymerase-3 subunit alpha